MKIEFITCYTCGKEVVKTCWNKVYCSSKCWAKNRTLKYKLKINNKCITCKKLIKPNSLRCHRCHNQLLPQNPRNAHIRYYREQGLSIGKIGKMFNISNYRVAAICRQKGWIYVGDFNLKFKGKQAYT